MYFDLKSFQVMMGLLGYNPLVIQGASVPWRRDDEQAREGTLS